MVARIGVLPAIVGRLNEYSDGSVQRLETDFEVRIISDAAMITPVGAITRSSIPELKRLLTKLLGEYDEVILDVTNAVHASICEHIFEQIEAYKAEHE